MEICTDVQTRHSGVLTQLQEIRDPLVHAADKLNIGICGVGTHPFQKWTDRKIFSKPRLKEVSLFYGYLAKQFTIFGQHVHVGCISGDSALFFICWEDMNPLRLKTITCSITTIDFRLAVLV